MKKIVTLLIALAFVGTSQQVSAVSTFSADFSTAQEYTITGTKATGKTLKVFLNHELVTDFVEAQGTTYSSIKPTEVGLYAVNSTTGKYRLLFPVKEIKSYKDKNVILKNFKPSASMKSGYNSIVAVTKFDDGAGKTKQTKSTVYTLQANNPNTPGSDTPSTQDKTITITSPENNAEIIRGKRQKITWETTNVPKMSSVLISIVKSDGTVLTIAESRNTGKFTWARAGYLEVPGSGIIDNLVLLPEGTYTLNIGVPTGLTGAVQNPLATKTVVLKRANGETTNNPNNPTTPADKVVTINTPTNNTELTIGEEQTVRWTTNVPAKEKAIISITSATGVETIVKSNAKNTGTFEWKKIGKVRGAMLAPGTYTLRVKFPEFNTSASTTVVLKAAPVVDPRQPMVELKDPEGGTTFEVGDTIEFKWDTKNIPANTPGFIQFIGGATTYNITNFTNTGKHSVRIDGQSVPLGTYTVKLIFGQTFDSITGVILKAADTTTPPATVDEYRCYIQTTAGSSRARWVEVECDSKAFKITPITQRLQIKKRTDN